jgi:hypothetical protein
MKSLFCTLVMALSVCLLVNSETVVIGYNPRQPLSPTVTNTWIGITSI